MIKVAGEIRQGHILALVMLLSICLNLWGNSWGTPDKWHPDEIVDEATALVKNKSLNPHFFAYGGLPYYVVAATAVLPVGVYNLAFDRKPAEDSGAAIAQWRDRKNSNLRIAARTVSALMGTLLVFFTYLIGDILFGTWPGVLAAAFLAVCPYFVEIAHFSTVDMAGNFWFWLSCLCSLMIWKDGKRRWYLWAAFTAGLATGVKADRLLAVLPMVVAHFLRQDRHGPGLRRIFGYGLLVPIGYIVANPTLLLASFEFLDGMTRELYFNILRGNGVTSYVTLVKDMQAGMGLPLFAASFASLAFLLYEFARGTHRRETGWLLSIVIPYYLVFGSRLSLPWYNPLFLSCLGDHRRLRMCQPAADNATALHDFRRHGSRYHRGCDCGIFPGEKRRRGPAIYPRRPLPYRALDRKEYSAWIADRSGTQRATIAHRQVSPRPAQ